MARFRYHGLGDALDYAWAVLRSEGGKIKTATWQGIDVSARPEAQMVEILDISLRAQLPQDIPSLQEQCRPNLPWADDQFEERVNGEPWNPGETWRSWPWGLSADKFRDSNGQFDHTYGERYWPKLANNSPTPHTGIRWTYGDLNDVAALLQRDRYTRQAYLPMFFPEDTGMRHGGRAPCSVGYHFIIRDGALHTVYYLRSCDFYRHLRDDLYLTARLAMWVRDKVDPSLTMGGLTTHITSLHCFINDFNLLNGEKL